MESLIYRFAGMGDTIGIVDQYFGLRYQVSVSVSMNLKLRYEYRYRYPWILNSNTSIGIDEIQLTSDTIIGIGIAQKIKFP